MSRLPNDHVKFTGIFVTNNLLIL